MRTHTAESRNAVSRTTTPETGDPAPTAAPAR